MSTETPESKPAGDEAWKEQVRRENAEAPAAEKQPAPGELPPASLSTLIEMLSLQAMVALGMVPHPSSGKPEPQIPLGRHFVDLLGVIEQKCAGNLSNEERALLDGTLHYLRMTYVEISKRPPEQKN